MGRRGPHPRPTQDKIDLGIYRGSRDGARLDVKPATGLPAKPADLGTIGGALWDHVIGEHSARKTLGTIDTAALSALCRTWELCQAAYASAKAMPTDKDARCSYLGYLAACDKLGAKFGWTASDRANLKLPIGDKKPSVPARARA